MTDLECERVSLFPDRDELWIIIIQTLPYPNISIIPAGYNEPEEVWLDQFMEILWSRNNVWKQFESYFNWVCSSDLDTQRLKVLIYVMQAKLAIPQCRDVLLQVRFMQLRLLSYLHLGYNNRYQLVYLFVCRLIQNPQNRFSSHTTYSSWNSRKWMDSNKEQFPQNRS